MALDLTPIYAILTAVVTLEPTAKASLIKGYRRLPVTVIGRPCSIIYIFIRRSITFYICIECDVFTILFLYKTRIQSYVYRCTKYHYAAIQVFMIPIFNLSRTHSRLLDSVTSGRLTSWCFTYWYRSKKKTIKTDARRIAHFCHR